MSEATFRAAIRANFRGLWSGTTTNLEFADAMFSSISRGFNQAWTEGAKECGIAENERTEEETARLNLLIGDNFQHVGSVADWIFQHSKANGYKFNDITHRADLWINRYQEVKNIAQSMACADKKLRWQVGVRCKEHCRTCLKLSGRVHRASVWAAHNIAPRMITDKLQCNGYRCCCEFVETDQPATRGRFPNLP